MTIRNLHMKQIIQKLKTGEMELFELPCPKVGQGQILIQTRASLISAGTERMLVEVSKAVCCPRPVQCSGVLECRNY